MIYVLFYTNFQGVDEYVGVYSKREEAQARIECFGKDDQLSFHIEEEALG